ncbi:MAG: alanine racemase [Lachnospiraceae bacterium]|nr:alanine racemase [Lachnospiraceae bacterium]
MEDEREYRRVYAKIDLDAIKYNVSQVQKQVGQDVMVMAVIKADGYGHGALPIAHALDKIGVDRFAVAFAEEGMMLRKGGIHNPILILGYSHESQYETILKYNLTPTVFTYETAKGLSEAAVRAKKTIPIHIKLETGMNRIGFFPTEETMKIIEKIKELPGIFLEGMFTHMARADETEKVTARKQMDIYMGFVNKLEERGISIPVKHVANSASIIDLKDFKLDMVRSGIMTYGLYPSKEVSTEQIRLKPAMEWKTYIVNLKEIEPGDGVSYGHIYVASEKRKIATLPVGYADGYPRSLSDRGRVLIHGEYAPIVGRVCMDQMMVDVTDIPEVKLLDEVTLMGCEHGKQITAEEIGDMAGSFNYELVCSVSKRVPRVICENGRVTEVIDYLTETLTVVE